MKVLVQDQVYRIVELPGVTEDDDLDAALSQYVGATRHGAETFWPDLPRGWRFDFDADTTIEPYHGDAPEGGER